MSVKQLDLDGVGTGTQDAAARVGRAAFAAILDHRKGNPDFRLTEAALVDVLRPAIAKELPKVARVNGRNVLFDALASACGCVAPITKSAGGQVAKALKEIREIDPTVGTDELARIAKEVRKKYENAGPMAVAAHWHEFVRRKAATPQSTAPVGWLAALNRLYPESTMARGGMFEIEKETEYQWNRLDAGVRKGILEAMQ